jgi:hypothetical protein
MEEGLHMHAIGRSQLACFRATIPPGRQPIPLPSTNSFRHPLTSRPAFSFPFSNPLLFSLFLAILASRKPWITNGLLCGSRPRTTALGCRRAASVKTSSTVGERNGGSTGSTHGLLAFLLCPVAFPECFAWSPQLVGSCRLHLPDGPDVTRVGFGFSRGPIRSLHRTFKR